REVTDIAPDMRITLHNASHILGSGSVHFHIGEGAHNLVYSGDIKFGFTRLFNNVDINYPRLETLIIESTYGGRDDIQQDRNLAEEQLIGLLKETMHKNGNTLIPVFSVGRAQEIMLVIEEYYRKGMLDGKVFVDGMTKEASAIHTAYPEYLRKGVQRRVLQNDSPFTSELFQVADYKNRDKIIEEKGAIIIASSGMLTGGPSVGYFQKMAENPDNTLIFVGYQGEGSLGNRIQKGLKRTPITENGKTRELPINMRVETVEGFSGHSDRNQLVNYVRNLNPKPKKIIVNHGEKDTAIEFARFLSNKFRINSTAIRDLDSVRLK
ncbi:MAG: beta-CASP ribonuclease aCPSF1, partial [Candidatus Diapherotrites archaeon CG_4_10_14_0_2_um_filter_31_5]